MGRNENRGDEVAQSIARVIETYFQNKLKECSPGTDVPGLQNVMAPFLTYRRTLVHIDSQKNGAGCPYKE